VLLGSYCFVVLFVCEVMRVEDSTCFSEAEVSTAESSFSSWYLDTMPSRTCSHFFSK